MVDLPKKKVGIVACSGEELPEGTVTRLAALKVLEQLRPADTVTICLPLFLAGGEGDRAFAKFYPTIAVDGCELRCAAKATEMYSGKPAAGVVVSELVAENGLPKPQGKRKLDEAGLQAVEVTSNRIAGLVDEILGKRWSRRQGGFIEAEAAPVETSPEPGVATCACGSGIPIQEVEIGGQTVTLIALPVIFEHFRQAGTPATQAAARELLETVKIYNPVPESAEASYLKAILHEYGVFLEKEPIQ
jgi:uncharacterized metal-binding protein